MRLHLMNWGASQSRGPMLAREEEDEDFRNAEEANAFCIKLNAILDEGGNCSLVNQRELYAAVNAIPMPTGFRHFRLVNSKNGKEIGHCFLTEGFEPSAENFHTTLGSRCYLVSEISNVRAGPLLEPGMLTLIADIEGCERYNYNPIPMYFVDI